MTWDYLLFLAIAGSIITISVVAHVAVKGIRYKRELPRFEIVRKIEALELDRENLEIKIDDLRDDYNEALKAIEEKQRCEAAIEDLRPQVEALQKDLQNLQSEEEILIAVRKDLDEAMSQLEETQNDRDALKLECTQIESQLGADRKELEGFKALKQELAELEQRIPPLRAEREELMEGIEHLRSDLHELNVNLEPLRKENAELNGEVQAKRKEREELILTIENLKKNHASAGGFGKDHDPCEDLWKPYFLEKKSTGGNFDERERLEGMMQELDGAEIRFPKRTLFAFHTALKIQDISPLTVLAGISGTGKSLLPRLYAKCMGMNFLNLPVQPGWNSPQDLFGFYNYIEQKYKATPLARAMVQFDKFNRPGWKLPKNEDLTNRILLVLLDEMNLARIEYYFSELLSRLELRRSIDEANSSERQKVEVPLEIGHGLRDRPSISLYPGGNVLFAGTMNEDESTMSLSDKVLDRASVLRFGKPHEIQTHPPQMDLILDSPPLGLGIWDNWQNPSDILPEMDDILVGLSEVMAGADAPFGHRVGQGVMSYISLYPDSSLSGQRAAMADQIEQKILPKLRGKDLNLVEPQIRKLQEIVTGLEDQHLSKAIMSGLNVEQGTFMWAGLDRAE
jgi:predicted  nucleic acid-binding Zn-ribbon protein